MNLVAGRENPVPARQHQNGALACFEPSKFLPRNFGVGMQNCCQTARRGVKLCQLAPYGFPHAEPQVGAASRTPRGARPATPEAAVQPVAGTGAPSLRHGCRTNKSLYLTCRWGLWHQYSCQRLYQLVGHGHAFHLMLGCHHLRQRCVQCWDQPCVLLDVQLLCVQYHVMLHVQHCQLWVCPYVDACVQ